MAIKSNDTAIRALEVLKILSYNELTQEEIIDFIFKSKKSEYEMRKDSLYKYLNTFKIFGINVIKNKNKYTLESIPLKTNFSEKELNTINFLYTYAQEICPENSAKELKKLLENLLKNTNYKNLSLENIDTKNILKKIKIKTNKEKTQTFCLLCKEGQRISFDYFNRVLNQQQTFIVEPDEVIITPTGEILKAFNPEIAEMQNFQIEDISNVKQLPTKARTINVKNSVTFKLKGRLALAYELKNGERVIKMENDNIVISNSEEDKDELLRRLLRYGTACEILYPKSYRTKFLDTLKNIKELYI